MLRRHTRWHRRGFLAGLVLLAAAVLCVPGAPGAARADDSPATPLVVLAASSLTDALKEIAPLYSQQSHQEVKLSFAASSALARQIEAGAPADVFVSADTDWMDYLQGRNLIDIATRHNIAGNDLVLIAPVASIVQVKIAPGVDLTGALGGGRLATGDPGSVPVGKYAKDALTRLGIWPQVADHVAGAENVRAALAYVARGETPLGIVYRTDALVEKQVRIVDTFPASSHDPIVYPAAATATAHGGAAFVKFLQQPAAQAVLRKYGFSPAP